MLHGVTNETIKNTVVVFELPGPDGANFYCIGIVIVINAILPSCENKMKSLILLFGLLILSSVAVAQDAGEDDAEGENW